MPAEMGEEERFAAAVEHGTTPAPTGRGGDGASSLARELEIAALLRSCGPALGPEPAARDRARRRLMTAFAQEFTPDVDRPAYAADDPAAEATGPLQVLAPVALAEREPARREPSVRRAERAPGAGRHAAPEPEEVPGPDAAAGGGDVRRLRAARPQPAPRGGHRRAALLGAAAAAALVALAGTGTFASRDALPGDPMYGVKRVAESTGYALTFGEQAKARRHLEQAQRRLDEVEGMAARSRAAAASGGTSGAASAGAAADSERVRSAMQEFDADTSEGSRLLLAGSTPPDTAEVDEVRTWATEQSERLSEIRSTLPAPDRADESLALLDRLLGETEALQGGACEPGEACAGTGPAPAPALTRTSPVPAGEGDARGRAGTSATARTDDTDVDAESTTDASSDGDSAPARTPTRGTGSSDTDGERRDEGDSGGGSGRSGGSGSGGSGSGGIDVPLPVPARVGVPPVGGLPGVSLGGG
jgi:uncharacterized membrane protein YgcG